MIIGRMSWLRLASRAAPSMTSATCACSAGVRGSTMAECTSGRAAGESSRTPISHRRSRFLGVWSRRPTRRQSRAGDCERGLTAGTVGRLRRAPVSQLDDQFQRDRFLAERTQVVPANRRGDRETIGQDVFDRGRQPADRLSRRVRVALHTYERGEAVTERWDRPSRQLDPSRVADVVLGTEIAADAGMAGSGARSDAVASQKVRMHALAVRGQQGCAPVAEAIVVEAEVVQQIAHPHEAQRLVVGSGEHVVTEPALDLLEEVRADVLSLAGSEAALA